MKLFTHRNENAYTPAYLRVQNNLLITLKRTLELTERRYSALKCGLERFELVIDKSLEITNICRDVVQMGLQLEAFKYRP